MCVPERHGARRDARSLGPEPSGRATCHRASFFHVPPRVSDFRRPRRRARRRGSALSAALRVLVPLGRFAATSLLFVAKTVDERSHMPAALLQALDAMC